MDLMLFLKWIGVDPASFQPGSHVVWQYKDPSGESSSEATLAWDAEENLIYAAVCETIQKDTTVIYSLDMEGDCTGVTTKGVDTAPGQSELVAFAEVFRENVIQMERVQ